MARKGKFIPTGPSHLSRVLANLNATPKLGLSNLKALKLSLAFRNDHFGARHFVKEQLPRIRYANPTLDIQVEKARKTVHEAWRPEMELEFANGRQKTLDLHEKWSTTILKELMDAAGGESWFQWKAEAKAAGLPIVPGEENEARVVKRPSSGPLPSLKVYRATTPPPATVPKPKLTPTPTLANKAKGASGEAKTKDDGNAAEIPIPPPRPKTGAAAVLP